MDDVTQDVKDAVSRIDFRVDTESHVIDEPVFQIGKAVALLNDETKLRTTRVTMDVEDGAPVFEIRGSIVNAYSKTLAADDNK